MQRSLVAINSLLALALGSAPLSAQYEFPAPVGVRVPLPPTPLAAMGHTYLGYELHLSSFAPIDLKLSRIDVYADGAAQPVASYRDAELAEMRLDPSGKAKATGGLPAGG